MKIKLNAYVLKNGNKCCSSLILAKILAMNCDNDRKVSLKNTYSFKGEIMFLYRHTKVMNLSVTYVPLPLTYEQMSYIKHITYFHMIDPNYFWCCLQQT